MIALPLILENKIYHLMRLIACAKTHTRRIRQICGVSLFFSSNFRLLNIFQLRILSDTFYLSFHFILFSTPYILDNQLLLRTLTAWIQIKANTPGNSIHCRREQRRKLHQVEEWSLCGKLLFVKLYHNTFILGWVFISLKAWNSLIS